MPSYKVIGKGTYRGRFYSPQESKDERRLIRTSEALDPVPKWLEPVKETTKPPLRVQKQAKTAKEPADFSGGKQEVL